MAHQTTQVLADTGGARDVLLAVVLRELARLINPDPVEVDRDPHADDLLKAADTAVSLPFPAVVLGDVLDRVDDHIDRLRSLRADVQAILTSDSDQIAVHLTESELADGLIYERASIEDHGMTAFWDGPTETRERIVASREAAIRLEQQFADGAVL